MEDSTPSRSKRPVIVYDVQRSRRVERNFWQSRQMGRWCAGARLPARSTCLPTEWAHLQRCHSPSGRRSHTLCSSRGAVGVLLNEWPCVITADHTVGGRQGPAGCSLRLGASRGLAPGRDGCMHPEHQAAVAQGPPAGGQGLLGAGLMGRRRRGGGRRRPPAVATPGAALRSSAAQGPQVARGARGAVHYHTVRWHVVPVVTHGNRIRWRGLSEPEVWGCAVRKQWRRVHGTLCGCSLLLGQTQGVQPARAAYGHHHQQPAEQRPNDGRCDHAVPQTSVLITAIRAICYSITNRIFRDTPPITTQVSPSFGAALLWSATSFI